VSFQQHFGPETQEKYISAAEEFWLIVKMATLTLILTLTLQR